MGFARIGWVVGVQQLNEFVAVAQCKLKKTWDEIVEKLNDMHFVFRTRAAHVRSSQVIEDLTVCNPFR
jgi:hypothetical protein